MNTRTTSGRRPTTFKELAELEPELKPLEAEAKTKYQSLCDGCDLDVWYQEFKPRVVRLIGYNRPVFHDVLSSSEAYDIAYQHLYKSLPLFKDRCDKCQQTENG